MRRRFVARGEVDQKMHSSSVQFGGSGVIVNSYRRWLTTQAHDGRRLPFRTDTDLLMADHSSLSLTDICLASFGVVGGLSGAPEVPKVVE
jgi:hypothetical protein